MGFNSVFKGLRILSVAQTTVEGMYNNLNNYSQRMFKEADVLKADPGIRLEGLRQITKNLRRYRRCPMEAYAEPHPNTA